MLRPLLVCLLAAGLIGCSEKPKPAPVAQSPAPPSAAPPLPAQAGPVCAKPLEKDAFNVASLKSELMVTGLSCQSEEKYNAFITRFRSDLVRDEKNLTGYFSRGYGRNATKEHDDYITALANSQSQDGIREGTGFCKANIGMFDEVMALKSGAELPQFAASKPLFQPLTVTECTTAAAKKPAPVKKK